MVTISVEEAQAKLSELIDRLAPGEEVTIVRDAVPVGKLVKASSQQPRPVPGRGRGKLVIVAEDQEHLKDFAEYMP